MLAARIARKRRITRRQRCTGHGAILISLTTSHQYVVSRTGELA
jgi:hypothetical protein